jgi:hypothetical protein
MAMFYEQNYEFLALRGTETWKYEFPVHMMNQQLRKREFTRGDFIRGTDAERSHTIEPVTVTLRLCPNYSTASLFDDADNSLELKVSNIIRINK